MILYATHRTTYRYPIPSFDSFNEVRLMPLEGPDQLCLEFVLTTRPAVRIFDYNEPGGPVHHFVIRQNHCDLEITAKAAVQTRLTNPFEDLNLLEDDWSAIDDLGRDAAEFLMPTSYVPQLEAVSELAASIPRGGSIAQWVIDVGERVNDLLQYDPDATHVHSTLMEVVAGGAGVCQDFAHLMLAILRSASLPARYVSGYLYVGEDEHLRGNQATHAWVECLLPGGRWLGLDPTNRQLANDHYIRVHTGRDYGDVSPTRGIYTGAPATTMDVSVEVSRDRVVEMAAS